VESLDDLTVMAELDVDYAQGYYLGEPVHTLPAELPNAMESCRIARGELMRHEPGDSPDRTSIGSVTAALAASVQTADFEAALAEASANLGIDIIALSTLDRHDVLREISCAGDLVDCAPYRLADYPATRTSLKTGIMVEAHRDDPMSDPAERAIMQADGIASLLLTPVIGRGRRLGILEFRHRTHRRWSGSDLAQARILAEHLASALLRMPERPTIAVARR
jgi:GAF domain-containing protein